VRYTVVFIVMLISVFTWIKKADSNGINDDDIETYGLQLQKRGYNALEVILAKEKFIRQHITDIPQRVRQAHIGTTYKELLHIWSGWQAKTAITTTLDGTVLVVDYDIPTLTDSLKEVHFHIVYDVSNGVVLRINTREDRGFSL
jgi:hypothetical protein